MKTKITVYWEEEFTERAKAYARGEGLSLSAYVEKCLDEYMENGKQKSSKEKSHIEH